MSPRTKRNIQILRNNLAEEGVELKPGELWRMVVDHWEGDECCASDDVQNMIDNYGLWFEQKTEMIEAALLDEVRYTQAMQLESFEKSMLRLG